MSDKRCDVSTHVTEQNLMKAPLEINFAEDGTSALKSCRNSSTVGIGCRYRTIASFARRMSMQTLTSPSPLGTTTKGKTHPDVPSGTSSIMSSSSSSSSFSSTFSRNPNGILRTCCATGFTASSRCSFSSYPFQRPTPENKLLYLSRISHSTHPLKLFAWKGPMCKTPSFSAVPRPSSVRPLPVTTTKSAVQSLLLPESITSAVKVPRVGNGSVPP